MNIINKFKLLNSYKHAKQSKGQILLLLLLCLLVPVSMQVNAENNLAHSKTTDVQHAEIAQVLTAFHQAAANAKFESYFAQLADSAIFLGTDGQERWTKAEFQNYVKPHFSKGRGWLYQATERNISDTPIAEVKIFDELLVNSNYGKCRGSGVMVLTKQGWKIAQYNLSIPVPNAIAQQVVEKIEGHHQLKSEPASNKG